jgi:hypothetical protein
MTQEGDWYSAMAITQRFKEKYTTFTYYTIDNVNGKKNNGEGIGGGKGGDMHEYHQQYNNGNKGLMHYSSSKF